MEIKTDKYVEKIRKNEQKAIEQKTHEQLEIKEQGQREAQLKYVKETLIKRDQEGMKFYTSVDTTRKLFGTGNEINPNHVAEALSSSLTRLGEIMAKCEKAQEDYVSAMTHSNRELTDDDKEWIVKIIKVFNGIYDGCKLFISMHDKRGVGLPSTPITIESSRIRLEKMKFEPFSRKLRKYPRFKQEFLKHIKPRYESHEEAFVLKSYLVPDIKEDVDNLGDNAAEIWKRLDRKYNDKSKMVDSIMTDIQQLSNSTEPSEGL